MMQSTRGNLKNRFPRTNQIDGETILFRFPRVDKK
nr:MAG TPA: hypothetical protein [Caudoviricetes sp.]